MRTTVPAATGSFPPPHPEAPPLPEEGEEIQTWKEGVLLSRPPSKRQGCSVRCAASLGDLAEREPGNREPSLPPCSFLSLSGLPPAARIG